MLDPEVTGMGGGSAPFLPQASAWLKHQPLPRRLAVGFSGGADSTALLLALHTMGHQVIAWHVDHAWHTDSSCQAGTLRKKAKTWGIEFHSVRIAAPSVRNREAMARKARYAQFSTWSISQDVGVVCIAHHRDDQAETVCMRMLQGAGVSGCAGMRPERIMHGLHLIRPLLNVSRAELKDALRQAGAGWLEDASNRDTSLMRNRIRHRLFPAMQRCGTDPDDLFLRWQAQASVQLSRHEQQAGYVDIQRRDHASSVHWHVWSGLPRPVRAFVLQRMMAGVFGDGAVLGRRHIELAESWRCKGAHGGIDLCRCRLSREGENLQLAPVKVSLRSQVL